MARGVAAEPQAAPSIEEPLSAASLLALQRSAGNRAAGRVVAGQSRGRQLARNGTGAGTVAPAPALPETMVRDVDRPITETISHAPAQFAAWNGTFSWRSKWRLRLNTRGASKSLDLIVRIYSTATQVQKRRWELAITSKWSDKFDFCVLRDTPPTDQIAERYPIHVMIAWVDSAADADYTVTANAPGANEGGRAGVGGTTSMTGWGTADTTDVTHEFGHMLGCPEEYFTTNGVDYAAGGKRGFRDPGGGVMNNPSGPALKRNFDVILQEAAALRGVPVAQTKIV